MRSRVEISLTSIPTPNVEVPVESAYVHRIIKRLLLSTGTKCMQRL
jgi:hypothetical protein